MVSGTVKDEIFSRVTMDIVIERRTQLSIERNDHPIRSLRQFVLKEKSEHHYHAQPLSLLSCHILFFVLLSVSPAQLDTSIDCMQIKAVSLFLEHPLL